MTGLSSLSSTTWLGHAALVALLGRRLVAAWRGTEKDTSAAATGWWETSEPWFATLACVAVVAEAAQWLVSTWHLGVDSQWAKTDQMIAVLEEQLPAQLSSVALALATWTALLVWPSWQRTKRRGVLAGLLLWLIGGVGSAAWGALTYVSRLPEARVSATSLAVVAEARDAFLLTMLVAMASLVVSAAMVGWCLARGPSPGSPEAPVVEGGRRSSAARWALTLVVVGASVGATVWLERIGTALAWENSHPIDVRVGFANCGLCIPGPPGIAGVGPHASLGGPIAVLGPNASVDGTSTPSVDEMFTVLRNKRQLWMQQNPDRSFPGALTINARALASVGDLEDGLVAARAAGYPKVQLLLSELEQQDRPVLGRLGGRRDSALSIQLARHVSDCETTGAARAHLQQVASRSLPEWLSEVMNAQPAAATPCLLLAPWHCPEGPSSCRDAASDGFESIAQTSIGSHVEAVRLRDGHSEYLVAFVPKDVSIDVLQMSAGEDPPDGFLELDRRFRRDSRRIVWAMNGGMYHPDRSPVGLLISGGEEVAPLNTADGRGNFFLKPNGVFGVVGDYAVVEETEVWAVGHWPYPTAATQSGPLLLEDGRYHPALKATSTSRAIRNAVGVIRDSDTTVLAISTAPVTFYELASLLRALGCSDALYLDGNVSSLYSPKLERRDSGRGLGPVLVVSEAAERQRPE